MNHYYRKWGIISTIVFIILAVPVAGFNLITILFSHMGTDSPWGTYLFFGPPLIFAGLVVLISIRSIFSPTPGSFRMLGIILALLMANLLLLAFGFGADGIMYSLTTFFYGLAGILQIQKFWRPALPQIAKQHFTRTLRIITIATIVSCAPLAYGVVTLVPKLPPDIKGIKFTRGSVQFSDDMRTQIILGQLAEEQEFLGIVFPRYTFLHFYKGRLSGAQLGENGARIQGIDCAEGAWVYFHDSGRLSGAYLGKDQEIQGILYSKGEYVKFNEDGTVHIEKRAQ